MARVLGGALGGRGPAEGGDRRADRCRTRSSSASRRWKQWLPSGWRKRPDGTKVEVGYDCRDFYRSNTPAKLGFVTVASLNLDTQRGRDHRAPHQPGDGAGRGVRLHGQPLPGQPATGGGGRRTGSRTTRTCTSSTLSEPGAARYVGSGVVEGHLLNQFSMDEHQGVLRVATTITTLQEGRRQPVVGPHGDHQPPRHLPREGRAAGRSWADARSWPRASASTARASWATRATSSPSGRWTRSSPST